jgi:hypothetical protein
MKIALIGLALIGGSLFFGKITLQEASQEYLPLDNLKFNSMDVECADLDKDGDPDMVIAMEFRPNVLLLNDGTGKMIYSSIGRLPQKNHDSEDIALGDFDRDGDLDIIFVSEDDHCGLRQGRRPRYHHGKPGAGFFPAQRWQGKFYR